MNNENSDFQIEVVPRGPDQATIDALASEVLEHPALRELLAETRHRLLSLELLEPETRVKPRRIPDAPTDFQATLYDYTNNRTIRATGSLADRQQLTVAEFGDQPLPNQAEFDEAVQFLMDDPDLGPALREQLLQPYAPMPPLAAIEQPEGRVERTVMIGLLPRDDRVRHEIVGVNLIQPAIVRFEGGAPGNAQANFSICGQPNAGQNTTGNVYVPGQVWITVTQGGTVLWRFLAVRPAASSGTNGSGIELRYVDYRGKRVLYRAHVPVLNVRYDGDACGPYLDWQRQEGMIDANGVDVAPGFRLCPTPATTILDTGSDAGNFLGVGIYVQGQEVVLVSEMQAGWYRYVSEWRLHADGTIRPRFGFGAVQSSCVCTRHHHHAYWRFDFDIRTAGNNVVQEFNDPPLFGGSNWHTKTYEIRRPRDPARNRKWLVQNTRSGEGYEIIPGPDDGVATASPDWPFPVGDVWILRYHPAELDNGTVAVGPPYDGGIDGFRNGEAISNHDVVIWYAGHVTHDIANELPGDFGHIVGPELRPVNW